MRQAFEIDEHLVADLPRIGQILQKYADLPADFADASLLAMCERRRVTRIATLDRDVDVYRMNDGRALTNPLRS